MDQLVKWAMVDPLELNASDLELEDHRNDLAMNALYFTAITFFMSVLSSGPRA